MSMKYLSLRFIALSIGLYMCICFSIFTAPMTYAATSSARSLDPSKLLPQPRIAHRPLVAPGNTTSLYESTANSTTLYNQGCRAAHSNPGLIVLDWGQPVDIGNGQYGTYDFGGHDDSDNDIYNGLVSFVQGVWNCRTSYTNIALSIGESNYYSGNALPLTTSAWYADGYQWGQLVNRVQAFIASHRYYRIISAFGAGDLETEWENFTLTSSLVNGYNAASKRIFFDFGDATPGYYTSSQLWYIAYGAPDNQPIPEIYYNVDATYDWEPLSVWACNHTGSPIYFRGAMSMTFGNSNSPAQAFIAMYQAAASNSCTAKSLPWLTFSTNIQFS